MIGIYIGISISCFVFEILRFVWYDVNDPSYDVTLHNDLLKNHEFWMIQVYHTQLGVFGD